MSTVETSPYGGPELLTSPWAHHRAVAGVSLAVTTVDGAARAVLDAVPRLRPVGGRGVHVHLASAHTLALAASHPEVDAVVNGDGWTLPDGKPITWVSALRGDEPGLTQTRGIDVFDAVLRAGAGQGLRHYLLGSTPQTLSLMQRRLRRLHPTVTIVGTHSPPFRPATSLELEQRDAAILASGADVVWVGLGTPKQDFEAARLARRLPVVALAVGAVFDFAAGTSRVAPRWMSGAGLEWLFRLLMEPRRLGRRYTVDSARFVVAAIRWGRRRRPAPTR